MPRPDKACRWLRRIACLLGAVVVITALAFIAERSTESADREPSIDENSKGPQGRFFKPATAFQATPGT
jgi:hypothetical protein